MMLMNATVKGCGYSDGLQVLIARPSDGWLITEDVAEACWRAAAAPVDMPYDADPYRPVWSRRRYSSMEFASDSESDDGSDDGSDEDWAPGDA